MEGFTRGYLSCRRHFVRSRNRVFTILIKNDLILCLIQVYLFITCLR